MIVDRFGLATSTPDGLAAETFEAAVEGLAGHRATTGALLARVLDADPNHVAAHALQGFGQITLARSELRSATAHALAEARRALAARDGGTDDERRLVEALDLAHHGHLAAAADRIDGGAVAAGARLLPFKIAQALRFMAGDGAGMLTASRQMLRTWSPGLPGAGFLLGCHAFALEEAGLYDEAERSGRKAVALQLDDAWGLHAVSHVHEMRGERAAGINWLEQRRQNWSNCNNFSFHIAWHLALLHLDGGDHDSVLALYDTEVRPTQTDDFRDMANAVSLLRRLETLGVDVGQRWQHLADIARNRRGDMTLVFASLHNLLALIALGDRESIDVLLRRMREKALGDDDQSEVARNVGLPLARILSGGHWPDMRHLEAMLRTLPQIGGSNAQRDVFVLALAEAATRNRDNGALERILAARRRLKADDRLCAAIEARALDTSRRTAGRARPPAIRLALRHDASHYPVVAGLR